MLYRSNRTWLVIPLAIEFAKKRVCNITRKSLNRKIIGFDSNNLRIKELLANHDRTGETSPDDLTNVENLIFTEKKEILKKADVFIVTVPTPINEKKEPDLSFLKKACKTIGQTLKEKKCNFFPVVIFESTVFPGATEEVCALIIQEESSLIYKK